MSEFLPQVPYAVFADGGVVGKNDVATVGTYCYVWVDHLGQYLSHDSGMVHLFPDVPCVTNNTTEVVAVLRALNSVPEGWSGTLYSDSKIALGRVFWGFAQKNMPAALKALIPKMIARVGAVKPVRLDGHPENHGYKELPEHAFCTDTIGHSGAAYSKWNSFCDTECSRLAASWKVEAARKASECEAAEMAREYHQAQQEALTAEPELPPPFAGPSPCDIIDALEQYLRETPNTHLHCLEGDVPGVNNERGPNKGLRQTRAEWTRRALAAQLAVCREHYLGAPCVTDEWVPGREDSTGRFVAGYAEKVLHDTSPGSPWGRYNAFAAPNVCLPFLTVYLAAATAAPTTEGEPNGT